jgi:hypothetical protein
LSSTPNKQKTEKAAVSTGQKVAGIIGGVYMVLDYEVPLGPCFEAVRPPFWDAISFGSTPLSER